MKTCYIYDNISLNSSCNEKCFRQTLYRKSKHILYLIPLFSENRAINGVCGKTL